MIADMSDTLPAARQLRRLVADRLRRGILEGRLTPGTWLRQEQIAREMGVSQMPVREAFRELAAEGLVVHEPYRGVRISSLTLADVRDVYAARAAIEALAIRAAATEITADELGTLRQLAAKMKRRLAPKHLAEYRDLNRQFHTVIFKASRRPYLIRLLEQLWTAFPAMLLDSFRKTAATPLPDRDTDDIAEHEAILEALSRHDPDAAEAAIRVHLEETVRHLTATLDEETPARALAEPLALAAGERSR